MYYIIFSVALLALVALCFVLKNKRGEKSLEKALKVFTVIFLTASMLDVLLPDTFMRTHLVQTMEAMEGTEVHALLRWANLVSFTVIPIAVFQKNKYFERIASFFCLPVAIINAASLSEYLIYFTTKLPPSGIPSIPILPEGFKDFFTNEFFRTVFFAVTCLSQIVALIILTYRNREKLRVAKNELLNLILIFIGVVYISVPVYVPQYLFGFVDVMLIRFSAVHFVWMILIAAVIVGLYFIFRNQSYESKYVLVLALSWALMMQFSQMFTASGELNVMKLPLQLCNLGSYLALITVAKKSQKLYHFTLIVNVVGALLAIVILDLSPAESQITRLWVVHFVVEHTKVFVIPILCLVLNIFKPLTWKSVKHFSVGFTIYFLFIFVFGTILNGLSRMFEGGPLYNFLYTNHLFLFDKDVARDLLGFTDPLFENFVIKIGTFEIYPIVQILIYVVFMAICLGVNLLIFALTKKQRARYAESQ